MLQSERLLRQAMAYDKLASFALRATEKLRFFHQRDQSIIAATDAANKGQ